MTRAAKRRLFGWIFALAVFTAMVFWGSLFPGRPNYALGLFALMILIGRLGFIFRAVNALLHAPAAALNAAAWVVRRARRAKAY